MVVSKVWSFNLKLCDEFLKEDTSHFSIIDYLGNRHPDLSSSINCPEGIESGSNLFLIYSIRLSLESPFTRTMSELIKDKTYRYSESIKKLSSIEIKIISLFRRSNNNFEHRCLKTILLSELPWNAVL